MKLEHQIGWGIVLGYIGIQLVNVLMKALLVAAAAVIVFGGHL